MSELYYSGLSELIKERWSRDDSVIASLFEDIEFLQQQLKDAEEVIEAIDEAETRRMYESCPDCYSDSLGCDKTKKCAQFKGRTLIQEIIDNG